MVLIHWCALTKHPLLAQLVRRFGCIRCARGSNPRGALSFACELLDVMEHISGRPVSRKTASTNTGRWNETGWPVREHDQVPRETRYFPCFYIYSCVTTHTKYYRRNHTKPALRLLLLNIPMASGQSKGTCLKYIHLIYAKNHLKCTIELERAWIFDANEIFVNTK